VRPESPSNSPGFLLWRVTLAWQRSMAAVLLAHDLTHVQFVLLANLWWLGDWQTQRQLADHAGTDPMMTSQVLRTLEGKGLVDRVVDAADSRARRVALTELGRAAVDQAMPDVDAADAAFFAAVPRDEVLAVLSRLGQPLGEPGE
jgi:MarR family transcriptional regulator, organic hydroperoxide resistance regulator